MTLERSCLFHSIFEETEAERLLSGSTPVVLENDRAREQAGVPPSHLRPDLSHRKQVAHVRWFWIPKHGTWCGYYSDCISWCPRFLLRWQYVHCESLSCWTPITITNPKGDFNWFKVAFFPCYPTFYSRSSWNIHRSSMMAGSQILSIAPCLKHMSSRRWL